MKIVHKKQDDILIVSVNGSLDAHTSGFAEKEMDILFKKSKYRFLLDLSGVEYLSSTGLRVLLALTKQVKQMGGKIVLCRLAPFIKEIFEVTGFTTFIPIHESVEEGLKEFD
jgi:anti-sigma B factor antagonist